MNSVACNLIVIVACLSSSARASDWELLLDIPAPEAKQAAAADQRFVYAITNDRIAKYDRETGQQVAVSSGTAKHLNSGFFWKGKLLCAHSNYPTVPEISEIKVLDTQTMRLSGFHEFGNYGGSLTWVVRYRDSWWCNFAKYGDENSKTFLVRFDDQWRERDRWAYPPSLIDRLGSYSLSGGLWMDDLLLVTGHDAQEVYRLRLPEKGSELEFVATEKVPFTGQGIAIDPKTHGLIGISRRERKLLLLAPAETR